MKKLNILSSALAITLMVSSLAASEPGEENILRPVDNLVNAANVIFDPKAIWTDAEESVKEFRKQYIENLPQEIDFSTLRAYAENDLNDFRASGENSQIYFFSADKEELQGALPGNWRLYTNQGGAEIRTDNLEGLSYDRTGFEVHYRYALPEESIVGGISNYLFGSSADNQDNTYTIKLWINFTDETKNTIASGVRENLFQSVNNVCDGIEHAIGSFAEKGLITEARKAEKVSLIEDYREDLQNLIASEDSYDMLEEFCNIIRQSSQELREDFIQYQFKKLAQQQQARRAGREGSAVNAQPQGAAESPQVHVGRENVAPVNEKAEQKAPRANLMSEIRSGVALNQVDTDAAAKKRQNNLEKARKEEPNQDAGEKFVSALREAMQHIRPDVEPEDDDAADDWEDSDSDSDSE